MQSIPTLFQRRLWRLVFAGFLGVILGCYIWDTLVFPTWREGYMTVTVTYANGQPACGLGVEARRLEPRWSYTPRGLRAQMALAGTSSRGTWRDLNSEHYGHYELRLYSDTTRDSILIYRQEFDVLPFRATTHVQVILDKPQLPTADWCVPPS